MLRAAAGEAAVQVLHGHQSALLAGLAIVWPDGDKDRGPEVFFDTAGFGEGHDLGFFGVFLVGGTSVTGQRPAGFTRSGPDGGLQSHLGPLLLLGCMLAVPRVVLTPTSEFASYPPLRVRRLDWGM